LLIIHTTLSNFSWNKTKALSEEHHDMMSSNTFFETMLSVASTTIFKIHALFFLLTFTVSHFMCREQRLAEQQLRRLPGPFIGRFTSLWLVYQGYKNTSNQYIHALHLKYGPVVRVAPNVISFNSVEAIPAIYGVRSGFPKPAHAANMDNYGKPNAFSTVSNEDHRRRRGRYASVYSKSNMVQGPAYDGILRRTQQVLEMIRDCVKKGDSVDIYKIFHYYAIDNASLLVTGVSMRLLDGQNIGYSQDLRGVFSGLAYVFYFPIVSWIVWLSRGLSHYLIPKAVLDALTAHERAQDMNLRQWSSNRTGVEREVDNCLLVRMEEHKDFGTPDLTGLHVASEVCDHLLAGMYHLNHSVSSTLS
jgi:hypothetical protein